ncbi:MAG: hypothetical protein IJW75_06325, partial [Alphaproteobacteria bacterium]|nr:hypothetical protein [Alphaproteobacteria bacterium]
MTKRMLIDDTQPEETRVVIVDGNKVEYVEFESSCRKQIKGNIYTAKVIRVEPSLQAAFIDYGGNKHGFLAFGEIHPDYYNLSDEMIEAVDKEVDEIIERKKQYIKEREEQREKIRAEKKALYEARLREEEAKKALEEEQKALEEQAKTLEQIALNDEHHETDLNQLIGEGSENKEVLPDEKKKTRKTRKNKKEDTESNITVEETNLSENTTSNEIIVVEQIDIIEQKTEDDKQEEAKQEKPKRKYTRRKKVNNEQSVTNVDDTNVSADNKNIDSDTKEKETEEFKVLASNIEEDDPSVCEEVNQENLQTTSVDDEDDDTATDDEDDDDLDNDFELQRKLIKARKLYHYSTIQDVIKEGQTLLVQVVKEERGNKGAAFTTYLSLAGRYCVLMPNRIKSGGVSRKITNAADRKRLKEIMNELHLSS